MTRKSERNTTIDRGSLDDTRIAEGVKLDNLVHVGHNCQIGAHSVIAAQAGLFRLVRIWKARGGRRAGRFWRALQTGGRCSDRRTKRRARRENHSQR